MTEQQPIVNVEWMDEEVRRYRNEVITAQQRINAQEEEMRQQARHIEDLEGRLANTLAQLNRIGVLERALDQYKEEIRMLVQQQDETYERTKKTLESFNVTLLRSKSLDAVGNFADGSLDFAYIDGDHCFDPVMQDLICWARKVRNGGLIMLHDYAAFWQGGVRYAVDAYTQCHLISPWYITQDRLPTAFWQKGVERA